MKDMPVTPDAPEVSFLTPRRDQDLARRYSDHDLPDGRRIVTAKEETVRVIPPGTRLLRRRRVELIWCA